MAAENRSYYYRYLVTACDILIPNKDPLKLENSNILGFTIEKDFDNDYFPIFNLQLNLSYTQYYTIIENRTTVKFKVKIEKFAYNENETMNYKEVVFDTIFSIFIDDNSAFLNKDLYNTTLKTLGTAENRATFDFYLFKDSDITASKKIFNRVISSSNMTNCIMYLLSKSGSSNVLMTPLDNSTTYNEIILPPFTVIQNIAYLEKRYGFYKHGALFFYDFNTTYFINKRAECTAYRTGEFKEVIVQVFKTLNSNSQTPGNFKDNKTKTYTLHVPRDSTEMITTAIVHDQLVGTNVNIINTSGNSSSTVSPSVQSRNKTTTNIVDNFNNSYLNSMIQNNKYENDNIINMNVYDVDIECFTPNKKFLMSFEDKVINTKYKGNYRLSYSLFTFIKNGDYFINSGEVQFKKTT